MSVEFGDKSIGQHGANIFYKEFTVLHDSNCQTYRLGSFYFVRKAPNPVTIAEFQLIWKNTYSGKKYASVKLYFNPEDDDDDDDDEEEDYAQAFGKDEVIEADRQVVIECALFPFWECASKLWNKDIGEIAFTDIPQDHLKNFIKDGCFPMNSDENLDVKIISYPQYCRFKTCKQMIKTGVPMTLKVFMARGGMVLKNMNTLILFSRWKFCKPRVEEFSLTRNVTVPVFKGRPRKKKRKEFMLLKKKSQKKLMKEIKKWKLSCTAQMKRKYTKRANKENSAQDGQSSASSAASRILEKYKRNSQTVAKKEEITKSSQICVIPKGRKPNDGRLRVNKLKKATLLQSLATEKNIKKEKESPNVKCDDDRKDDEEKFNGTKSDDNCHSENCKEKKVDMKEMFDEIPPREEFIKELYAFMNKLKKPILKIPSMGHAPVDFHDLFTTVVKYGGYGQVTVKRQWREIYDVLGRHSNDITNAATSVRKIYENHLLLYENKMRKDMPALEENEAKDTVKSESKPTESSTKDCKKDTVTSESKPTESSTKYCKKYKIKKQPIKSVINGGSKRNALENKPIPLENGRKPCEYKLISTTETGINKPVPLTSACGSNISEKAADKDNLLNVDVPSSVANTENEKLQAGSSTSFTLQAGEAFKLMIQKRRGRPSNDFRRQIEQLKTMNHKVEVEIFSPVGKKARLPTWLNELNVNIVNPRRKRKRSAANNNSKVQTRYINPKVQISPLSKGDRSHVTNGSHAPNSNETDSSSQSTLNIETISMHNGDTKQPNGLSEIMPKSTNGYINTVSQNGHGNVSEGYNTKDDKNNDEGEVVNTSVENLIITSSVKSSDSQTYIQFPSHPITVPQSVLTYNQYKTKYSPLTNNLVPQYPITSLSNKEFPPKIYRKEDLFKQNASFHMNDINRTATNLDGKTISGPNIRHIHFPSSDKRPCTTSNNRLPTYKDFKKNIQMEKMYIHSSSHIKDTNGSSTHEPMTRFPHMTLIPAQSEPQVSASNLTLHSYMPPSNIYMSPTATIYKNISGVRKSNGIATVSKPSFENSQTSPLEPIPKVYILPNESSWVLPRTSV